MKIQSVANVKHGPIKTLIYGAPGSGKTFSASTLPHSETLVLSSESGLLTLSRFPLIQTINLCESDEGKPLNDAAKVSRLNEVFTFLNKEETKKMFKHIVVDSITEIGDFVLNTWKEKFPKKADSYDLWGGYGAAMVKIIKDFRDLTHYNTVILALEEYDKDDQSRMFFGPKLAGTTPRDMLAPAFDEVFRLTTDGKNGPRYFITKNDGLTRAKDRSDRLAATEEANLSKIFEKIRAEEKKDENKEEKNNKDNNKKEGEIK